MDSPASSSSASASWGTHLGCTKLVASIVVSPASASRSRNSSLTATGTIESSFCSPSRAPTSQIVTAPGRLASGARTGSPRSRAVTSALGRQRLGAALLELLRRAAAAVVVVRVVVDLAVDQGVHLLHLGDVVELERLLRRGLDDQRAAAEDAVDEPVLEPDAVDAAERDVDAGAVDHALARHHPVGGHDEVGRAPPQERHEEEPDEQGDADDGDRNPGDH